jgi:ammonium transporter, Amt family
MKKLIALLTLLGSLAFAGAALAQDKPAAMPDKPAAEATAPAAAAAPAGPKVDKGDTTWMMVATSLVILMTIPGLALFYGGMVRAKNTLSVLMQVFVTFCLIAVLWVVYGYSITFTGGGAFSAASPSSSSQASRVNRWPRRSRKGSPSRSWRSSRSS